MRLGSHCSSRFVRHDCVGHVRGAQWDPVGPAACAGVFGLCWAGGKSHSSPVLRALQAYLRLLGYWQKSVKKWWLQDTSENVHLSLPET